MLVCRPPVTQLTRSSWGVSPDVAVVGSHLKTVDLWILFPFFNDYRRHLRTPCCFWDESELWVCMGANIINEVIMGSAGSLKTCCWWRRWWETWHNVGQAVQPYGMFVGSSWQLAGVGFLAYGSCRQHEGWLCFQNYIPQYLSALEGTWKARKHGGRESGSQNLVRILWQCMCSQKVLRNVSQDQTDTDLLILHIRSF